MNLVDELWLLIYPVTLGTGKKLFDNGTIPAAFSLIESTTATPSGVIAAHYKRPDNYREREVKTGNMGG